MKFSPVVQYLRALAATMVLCYHVILHWVPLLRPNYLFLSAGVDIFFVISGFVMWSLAAGREGGGADFFARRFRRIAPLYWLMTSLMLLIILIHPDAALTSRFDWRHVALSYAFIPAIHPVKATFEPLVFPGWTLNYEMMFYLVFAFALCGPMRLRPLLVLGPLGALMAAGLIPHANTSLLAFYSSSLLLEFGMGCVIGMLVSEGHADRAPSWLGAALIGFSLLSLGLALLWPRAPRGLTWGAPAALFVGGWIVNERVNGTPKAPLLQLLGDASYSIYLSQVIVLSALFQLVHRFAHGPAAMIVAGVAMTAGGVLAGVGVYWFIERPILRWLRTPAPVAIVAAAQ